MFQLNFASAGIDAETFLRDYWQQKPLLFKGGIEDFRSPLTPDELGGLACEEEIESRIVLESAGATPWELLTGPFDDATFANLPTRDWTLLVQGVDQFLPEVAELLKAFQFIPDWRLDDIMISYAAPGGSVGPHYDQYDVFLVQGLGTREWILGETCDNNMPRVEGTPLHILQSMPETQRFTVEPGDVLYVPPRLAHHGVAIDDCMTYSVGFRAPSTRELVDRFAECIANHTGDDERYRDPQQLHPRRYRAAIDAEDVMSLNAHMRRLLHDEEAMVGWFGALMTEPKYPDLVQPEPEWTLDDIAELATDSPLQRDSMARLAWFDGKLLRLFANGETILCEEAQRELVIYLCENKQLDCEKVLALSEPDGHQILLRLLQQGVLFVGE